MANRLVDALLKAKKKAEDLAKSAYQNVFQTNKPSKGMISPVESTVYHDTPITKNIKTAASVVGGGLKQIGNYAGDIYQGGKATTKLVARAILPDKITEQNLSRQRALTEAMAIARKKGNTEAVKNIYKSAQGAYKDTTSYLDSQNSQNLDLLRKQQKGVITGGSMVLGGPKLLTKTGAVSSLLGGGINAAVAKFQGGNAPEEFGRGVIKTVPVLAMSRFTDPVITKAAGSISPQLSPAVIQAVRRVITGAGNVGEGKILSKMNQTGYSPKDAAIDFATGAVVSPKANEELGGIIKKGLKGTQEDLIKKVANFLKKNPEISAKEPVKLTERIRAVKVTENGQPMPDIMVKDNQATRRGTNQYSTKYKDFVPAGGAGTKQELNAIGGVAGIEYEKDENGKITGVKYDPAKGAAGFALMAGVTSPQGKKLTKDILEKVVSASKGGDGDYLYHTTSPKNIQSIAEQGLKPGKGQYGKAVYMAPKPEMTGGYGSPEGAMLRIKKSGLSGLQEFPDQSWSPNKVDSKNIEVSIDNGKSWKPLSPQGVEGTSINTPRSKVELEAGKTPPKLQTEVPVTSKVLPESLPPIVQPKKVTPESVASELPTKINNFVQNTLGYSTANPVGGTKEASAYTKVLRKGQSVVTRGVEKALGSENAKVRTAASTIQGFFKGIGTSPERAQASTELRGGIAVGNERAYNVMDSLYGALDNNKKSLERINAVLDPKISKFKLSYDDLTPKEQKVHDLIRNGFDLVHDTSFANGHIDESLYTKNKGKYVPRLYQPFELPEEVNKFVNSSTKKVQTDLYKSRTDINDWKTDASLNDPVYALGKRLAQVETNTAIKNYTDFLAKNPNLVSEVEKPGFVKLSDSKAYGSLSGKYVLNSAAEELKGHFFANAGLQNVYDAFRSFDRLPIRQLQKKLLTVFNPTTNVGNIVSDNVFGFMTGVDPLTLNKNIVSLTKNKSSYKQLSDYLMKVGVTGTDITRSDFVNRLSSVDELAKNAGKKSFGLSTIPDKIQSFYGGTDDIYKVAAFKSLLDQGKTLDEATRLVADGFQNYANVGKFYDVWAKTPVVGSAFIKFQGDLIRIIKNAVVNRPLQLITFLATLKGVAELSSRVSGESPQDKKTREERFAAPMIPGLNIPLTWQTPFGEINVARYISPFYANNDVTDTGKMIPGLGTAMAVAKDAFSPNPDFASTIAKNVNDPLLSPAVQLLVNRDFRGKRISDPNENKYQPSTLTSGEKLANQAKFLTRSYSPPLVNTGVDIKNAAAGEPDYYGRTRSVPQAAARAAGIKIEQFGPAEAQKQREKDATYEMLDTKGNQSNIRQVFNDVYDNNLPFETALKRIKEISSSAGGNREVAEGLHSKIMSLPKEDRASAYQKASKYLSEDVKNEMLAISKMEALGLSSEDRLLLTIPVELRAQQVHARIMALSPKSRAKKYQQLVDGGVITPEMKNLMLKLLQGK